MVGRETSLRRFPADSPTKGVDTRTPFEFVTLLNSRVRRFQELDCIAQLGRAFVKLAGDRDFHLPLHDLEFREWTLGADLLEPFFQKGELGAFRSQFRKMRLLK